MIGMRRPAATIVALACVVLPGIAAWAQTNSAYRSVDAAPGKPHRLGVYGNVTKDCTSGPLPTIRVVTPPKHGELNVRSGTLKAGRITRCPKLEAKAQGVFYRADAQYTGTDEVSYEVKSASGKVESHTIRINATSTPPAVAKPSDEMEL